MEEITVNNYKEFITTKDVVVVKYYGTWCGPCKMMDPIVDEIATEHTSVTFGKVDIDKEPNVAVRYGVRSIPTMLIFKNGGVVDRIVGAVPKASIEDLLGKHLN